MSIESAQATFINVIWFRNRAKLSGGINMQNSKPIFKNCTFEENEAKTGSGGAVTIRGNADLS